MPTTFRPYEPDQILLLPPDLRDWVPEGHLAPYVNDLVASLDLRAFYAPCDGRRSAPYAPSMVKMLRCGCLRRVIFRNTGRSVNFGAVTWRISGSCSMEVVRAAVDPRFCGADS